jgi:hypothetical protein
MGRALAQRKPISEPQANSAARLSEAGEATEIGPMAVSLAPDVKNLAASVERRLVLLPAAADSAAPLPLDPVLLAAGANVAVRSIGRRLFGWKRYPGSVEAICRAAIEDCWTGEFFAGSAGHFKQFWTRDLAMSTPALCRMGFRDRVVASWAWGLERFERAGHVTTTIFNRRFPRDVYAYGCDSLPLLLYGLREAGAEHLVHRHGGLLADAVTHFATTVFDEETGLARADGYFSGPRDCMTGRSTVFANTMIALLGDLLDQLPELPNPFRGHDARGAMMQHLWSGDFFRDSLCREIPSGDANVWPFFFGVFDDPEMQRRAFGTLEARGFTRPIPLRYFERRMPESELPIPKAFTPNYQGDTCWMQLAPAYLRVLEAVDPEQARVHRATMSALIARDQHYLELYTPEGKPYKGRAWLYYADAGMIWAAMFLDLL